MREADNGANATFKWGNRKDKEENTDTTYSITQEGLEKVWEAVQDLSRMRKDRVTAWDKPETHAKYWNAKQRLVEVVMETFGEDWGDVKVGQKEI